MFGWLKRAIEPPIRTDADDLTDIVVGLIKGGRDWVRTKHVWWHPAGISVWVANKDYGLGVRLNAASVNEYYSVASLPADAIQLSPLQRKAIWNAVNGDRGGGTKTDALRDTVRRVLEMYDPATLTPPPCGPAPASSEGDRE